MKRKFWNWVKNEGDSQERTLFLNGEISDETWYGDEVTPQIFKDELNAGKGNITVWINSPGGDVFAAAQIYNMLRDYKGAVTVKIDGLAASAASVIAMAGDEVLVSPVAMMMIHNPATIAMGNAKEMERAIGMLNEVKESILNAYETKTGLNRVKLSHMMDEETWFNAKKAVELGFADKILFSDAEPEGDGDIVLVDEETKSETGMKDMKVPESMLYSQKSVSDSFLSKVTDTQEKQGQVPIEQLRQRLSLIAH